MTTRFFVATVLSVAVIGGLFGWYSDKAKKPWTCDFRITQIAGNGTCGYTVGHPFCPFCSRYSVSLGQPCPQNDIYQIVDDFGNTCTLNLQINPAAVNCGSCTSLPQ